jgi:hypothetical protein
MKAPPITLRCDCGRGEASVAYGERWECPRCGRAYDTASIPRAEYDSILALRRRYRLVGWALAAVVAAFVLFLAVANQPLQILAGLPLILVTWFLYVRPLLRRRYLRAIADRPRWQVRAEPAPPEEARR